METKYIIRYSKDGHYFYLTETGVESNISLAKDFTLFEEAELNMLLLGTPEGFTAEVIEA